mgnify:FL=1
MEDYFLILIKDVKNIVLGKFYKDREELENYISANNIIKSNCDINLYQNIQNVAEIMTQNDIAISVGGTTLVELASLGIPTICFSMADNQIPGTIKYAEDELMLYAGDIRKDKVIDNIVENVDGLTQDIEKLCLI